MNTLKKIVASSVVVTTVMSMVVAVAPVKAAATAGSLIKQSGNSSVYYLGADSKRYVFPNEATYKSWYSDFSQVQVIPQAELESYMIGGNVTIRPGTKLVKITTNPKVYAVEPGGSLVALPDETTATTLYGADWAKRVVDVPDAFFINYKLTTKVLTSAAYPAGSLVKFSATSPDVYYINSDGTASKVSSESAFVANRFEFANVMNGYSVTIPALGAEITGGVANITDLTAGSTGGTYVGGTGVTVALSGTTPASASVPKNGARVPMTKVNLTAANDGAITINSITVKRIGLSSYTEIDKVWAEKAGVVVAAKKSVSSNDEAILTFSPALTIAAGQTVTLDLLASLANASGNIGLGIVNAAAVTTTGAAVSGSFPIYGNIMAPINYTVAELAVTTTGATSSVKVGDEKVVLGDFTVDFRTASTSAKDVTLTSIMLKNNGVEDLTKTAMNMYLEVNGVKVTDRYTVDGRFVTFYFPANGYDMLKDDGSKIFKIKGDIIGKENTGANSYVFALNKSTDFMAYEKSTGFGVNTFNNAGTVADALALNTVTINAGAIAITKKSTSPSDTTIIKGADNTVLLANIRADEAINVDGLNVIYGSNASNAVSAANFENVRVYVNGVLVDSFDPSSNGAAQITKTIDSSISLAKGDNEVKVMARAKTTAISGAAFLAKLQGPGIFAGMNPEYVSSGNAVATGDISGTATGAIFTVQGATMTIVRNDGYANGKKVVKGGVDVSVGKFAIKATNDDVTVTSIALGANTGTTSAANIYDAKLYIDGVQVGTTQDFGSTGATFQNLNLSVLKDKTKTAEVKVSFDSSALGGFQTMLTINANDSRGSALVHGANGNVLTGVPATTAYLDVVGAGSLTVALGGDAPTAAILVAGGAAAQEIAQYKFTAVNDSATITEINFANGSTTAPSSAADAIVSAVALYDGATMLDNQVFFGGTGKFTIPNGVVVSANTAKTLSVKVLLNAINNDAAATNKDIQFVLSDVKFKSSDGTVNPVQTENDAANAFRVRKTVPTVALQALPTTLLTSGDQVVSKFTVAANATGDVTLKKVVLTTASSGVTAATIANNAIKVNGVTKAIAATVVGNTIVVDFGATPEIVSAGTSKTFEVSVNLTTSTDNDSFTTKIVEDAAYATDGSGSFVWSDGASIEVETLSNSHRVPGLPTTTQVLTN